MSDLDPRDAALAASVLQQLDPIQQTLLKIQAHRNGYSAEQEIITIVRTYLDQKTEEFYAELLPTKD